MPEFASVCDYYKHYKYYHFFAVCFGLSCGLVSYRPRVPTTMSLIFTLFFTVVFEVMGLVIDLPAHTTSCQGRPYDKTDVILGFVVSIFVAVLHNNAYYACTLSYGLGIMTFAVVGTVRKYNSLRGQESLLAVLSGSLCDGRVLGVYFALSALISDSLFRFLILCEECKL